MKAEGLKSPLSILTDESLLVESEFMFRRILLVAITWGSVCLGCNTPAQSTKQEVQTDVDLKMVLIEPGTFVMGAPMPDHVSRFEVKPEPTPPHEVTLTTPYYLSVYEITNAQFDAVMTDQYTRYGEKGDPNSPVHIVNWADAIKFCERLNELPASKADGKVYRLPTEAEWEYACRAGSTTNYCFGDEKEKLHEYAWFIDREIKGESVREPQPVGMKKPNAWGLYDMHGNVAEFCLDYFAEYPPGPVTDPQGPKDGYERVIRGGTFSESPIRCRSANREEMSGARTGVGFRVAMTLASQIKPVKSVKPVPLADFDRSSELDHRSRSGPLLPLSPLNYEAMIESFWNIDALLADGADPNARNADGRPILFEAIDHARFESDVLRSNWRMEDEQRELRKLPPLKREEPLPSRLEALLQAGADPNVLGPGGMSALHYAIARSQTNTVRSLCSYGADVSKPDDLGMNAMEAATVYGYAAEWLGRIEKEAKAHPQVGKPVVPPRTIRTPDQQLGSTNFRLAFGGVAITFSADGKQIVAGERAEVIRVFDSVTGARVSAIDTRFEKNSNHYIASMSAIPNSRIVFVSGGIGCPARFWNIDSGVEVMRLDCHCIQGAVSPNGKFLFTGDYLCEIESTDPLKLSAVAREFRGNLNQRIKVRASFFSPDSRFLIFVDDEKVRVWDVNSDEVVAIQDVSQKQLESIRWGAIADAFKTQINYAPDDLLALTLHESGFLVSTPEVLAASKRIIEQLRNRDDLLGVALSPDNTQLAALRRSGRIEVFVLGDSGKQLKQTEQPESVNVVAVSADDRWVASAGNDKSVTLWDKSTSEQVRTIPIGSSIRCLCFGIDNNSLAIGADSGLHMHDLVRGKTTRWNIRDKVTGLQLDEARNALIVLSNKLELRDMKSGKLLSSVPAGAASGGSIAYAQKDLLVGSLLGKHYSYLISDDDRMPMTSVWSIAKNELKVAKPPNAFAKTNDADQGLFPFRLIALSRDGKYAANTSSSGRLQLWDLAKQKLATRSRLSFHGSLRALRDIEFSFDSKYVAGCFEDGTARVWEVESGRHRLIIAADDFSISDIAYQPNGQLITANNDGTIHIWDIAKHLAE